MTAPLPSLELSVRGRDVCLPCRSGVGTPLVLVHGAGRQGASWSPVLRALRGARAYAPSLPGRPGSPGPALESTAEQAAWLLELIAALDVGPAIVVGHSMGGAVAIEAALADGDAGSPRVAGLVLVATGARLRVHPSLMTAFEAAAARGERLSSGGGYVPSVDAAAVAEAEAIADTTPSATAWADWRGVNRFDRMADLGRIHRPVTVIYGHDDVMTPEKYARYLVTQLPRAELRSVAHAGHQLPVEQPAWLAAQLDALAAAPK